MSQVQFAGSWYLTTARAAAAWAETALPDVSVIGAKEDASEAASATEAYWWGEAQKIGEGAPEDVSESEWRAACRKALVTKIETHRGHA